MNYPIAEVFYSIIGEGEFTGQAAFFIRLAGCNLNCNFCDTDYEEKFTTTPEKLYKMAIQYPSRKVVITGGEPTIYELKPLTSIFRKDFKIHLETNGSKIPDSMDFDWIAVSPKNANAVPFMISYASEIKFLYGIPGWEDLLKYYSPKASGHKWLLPVVGKLRLDPGLINIKLAVDYCLQNPQIRFCCQIHKVIGVR